MADASPRCLVIVRAGDSSLHPSWTTDRATRGWDLVISYFGRDSTHFHADGDRRIDDPGQKWAGLHALLTRERFWRDYDYVWLPDDDIAAAQHDIQRLFAAMHRWQLELAQPALSWRSHYSHPVTLCHPTFTLRLTNFVEIMAPCFASGFLARCLPTFTESLSGWGLDFVWPSLLPESERRVAIVDEALVTHTRPVGGPSYDRLRMAGISPADECARTLRKYGVAPDIRPVVHAGIDRHGRHLDPLHAPDSTAMRTLLANDQMRFELAMLVHRTPHAHAVTFDPGRGAFTWREE